VAGGELDALVPQAPKSLHRALELCQRGDRFVKEKAESHNEMVSEDDGE
jgi:hypothetical protein